MSSRIYNTRSKRKQTETNEPTEYEMITEDSDQELVANPSKRLRQESDGPRTADARPKKSIKKASVTQAKEASKQRRTNSTKQQRDAKINTASLSSTAVSHNPETSDTNTAHALIAASPREISKLPVDKDQASGASTEDTSLPGPVPLDSNPTTRPSADIETAGPESHEYRHELKASGPPTVSAQIASEGPLFAKTSQLASMRSRSSTQGVASTAPFTTSNGTSAPGFHDMVAAVAARKDTAQKSPYGDVDKDPNTADSNRLGSVKSSSKALDGDTAGTQTRPQSDSLSLKASGTKSEPESIRRKFDNRAGELLQSKVEMAPHQAKKLISRLQSQIEMVAYRMHEALLPEQKKAAALSCEPDQALSRVYDILLGNKDEPGSWKSAAALLESDEPQCSDNLFEAVLCAWLHEEIFSKDSLIDTAETLLRNMSPEGEVFVKGLLKTLRCEPEDYLRDQQYSSYHSGECDEKFRKRAREITHEFTRSIKLHIDATLPVTASEKQSDILRKKRKALEAFLEQAPGIVNNALRLKTELDISSDEFKISWVPRGSACNNNIMCDWLAGSDDRASQAEMSNGAPTCFSMSPLFEIRDRVSKQFEAVMKAKVQFEEEL